MASRKQLVVFVHGWSVRSTDTYGALPERLIADARGSDLDITVKEIFLGKYVSFRDEVTVADIAYAFQQAYERDLAKLVAKHGRFAAITHSTGGPVMREWADRFHGGKRGECPMSHLVMLAPANFGSALAQLGKSRLSRIKTWFQGVEPGQGVLNWLELGSAGGFDLNARWIKGESLRPGPDGVFQFVLTGQTIDRKLYDHLNSYTGELGSDGVVRVPAANLNATLIRLEQDAPPPNARPKERLPLRMVGRPKRAAPTAFFVVPGKSHSGGSRGIMRSVKADPDGRGAWMDQPVTRNILESLRVRSAEDYQAVCESFDEGTESVQREEQVEYEDRLLRDRCFIHDRRSMVVFRVRDDSGASLGDFDLLFTAGAKASPNALPEGFATDRQRNQRSPGTLTYFFDYDLMHGCAAVVHDHREVRAPRAGAESFGLQIDPRPTEGFVHYLPAGIEASAAMLKTVIRPNETTLVDIVLRRNVREGVFRLDREVGKDRRFDGDKPGPIV